MRPAQVAKAIEVYCEYIPKEAKTDEEKLSFIICAMPNAGAFPAEFIVAQLVYGPVGVNPREYHLAKPNIVAEWRKNVSLEELARAAKAVAQHKHVLAKYKENEDWLLYILITETFDTIRADNAMVAMGIWEVAKRYLTNWYKW